MIVATNQPMATILAITLPITAKSERSFQHELSSKEGNFIEMHRRICHEELRCLVGQARILAKDCVLDASLAYRRNMRHSITEVTNNR
jgi:hypothetical protein